MRRLLKLAGILLCLLAVPLMTGWGALAIYYSDLAGEPLRLGLACGFALAAALAFLLLPNRSFINPKARAVGDDPQFSAKIRQGLPKPSG